MTKEEDEKKAIDRLKFAAKAIGKVDVPSALLADIAGMAEGELEKRAEEPEIISIQELKEDIETASADYGKISKDSITTGLDIIDRMIGGLKPAEVTLVCANPNVGKSWLVSDMAIISAYQVPTLFITLEMRAEQLGARMKIYIDKVNGVDENWTDGCQMFFQKAKTLDYRNIKKLFEVASDKGIKAVFLDYLQYLGVGMEAKEMAKISRMFHEMALVYNIPIVIVASLRKDSNTNKRKWYDVDMFEISGVGAIAYDADNVLAVGRTDPADDHYTPEHIWVKHIKSRNMPIDGDYPYGKMIWNGGSIENDQDWNNEVGKYYGHSSDRPTIIKVDNTKTKGKDKDVLTKEDWIPDDKDIKPMSEFEQRKLGFYKKG